MRIATAKCVNAQTPYSVPFIFDRAKSGRFLLLSLDGAVTNRARWSWSSIRNETLSDRGQFGSGELPHSTRTGTGKLLRPRNDGRCPPPPPAPSSSTRQLNHTRPQPPQRQVSD